jgi:hypothetical protein
MSTPWGRGSAPLHTGEDAMKSAASQSAEGSHRASNRIAARTRAI